MLPYAQNALSVVCANKAFSKVIFTDPVVANNFSTFVICTDLVGENNLFISERAPTGRCK
jgi:hypothetical protein